MIFPGIKDLHIHNWITAEHACIMDLPFGDFMKELYLNYLSPDWEDQVCNEILTSTLVTSKLSFWNWSQKLLKLNCLLHGTPSVFDNATIHYHLEAHLDDKLKAKLRHHKARKDKNLKTWILAVHLLDEARAVETKHQHELIEKTLLQRQSKRQNTNSDTLCGPSRRGNTTQSGSSASALSSTQPRLPLLTDNEHTLLNEHDGCTKCRCFYTNHCSQSCPNGFPVGKGYKTLTMADALTTKKAKAVAKPTGKAVAATSVMIKDIDTDDEITATDGEYNSDSDEDWDVSHCEVSPPLHGKHLIWCCQAHSLTEDFPVTMHALINNGAHLVLVSPKSVEHLGLKICKLCKPKIVDITFSNRKKKTELYNYIKLSLTSLDSIWTSHFVKAIVTPGLCAPIILGLPWLTHNTIVTDHATHTCIDKTNSYDLLNPAHVVPPPPPKLKLHEQIKVTKADKKLVLTELMMVCNDRINHLNLKPEKVKDFNVAGAVRQCIEILASQELLAQQELKLKTEYKMIFEPIPHADELPNEAVAEIHIKDAEKTIKSHSYMSPRKYKEASQILIQQHLDAGWIRPSSSPYTSPAFIVPKANLNVLPHWVNDFRQLNENTMMDSHPLPWIDDILNDCAKGKIWVTIDMTNSFFQTWMHPDHVHLTAVNMPLGFYE